MNLLIVYCHPEEKSFNKAILERLKKGILKNSSGLKIVDLYRDKFDPVLRNMKENDGKKVIVELKKDVAWCDKLVIVSPMWWAGLPAMLKGFFDRIFTEGFAFRYNQMGMPEGLLSVKEAFLISTCDTPLPLLRLTGGWAGYKSVRKGILNFCGIKKVRIRLFGSVKTSSDKKRKFWLKKAEEIGEMISKPLSPARRFFKKVFCYYKAARFRLASFVFGGIILGVSIGCALTSTLNIPGLLFAVFIGLFSHAAVSYSNEASDTATDKKNTNRTMFNGGSGLIIDGSVSERGCSILWKVFSLLTLVCAAAAVILFGFHWIVFICATTGLFLGLGYSIRPLSLSRRGLGEVAAFIAYGFPVILGALSLQVIDRLLLNRILSSPIVYLLSALVSVNVFSLLSLTQIPDYDADKDTGKKSIAVLIGKRGVIFLCSFSYFLSLVIILVLYLLKILPLNYILASSFFPSLMFVLLLLNRNAYKKPAGAGMQTLMGMGITTAVFSSLIPAAYFFGLSAVYCF